jgi:hypothetical protein
MVASDLSPRPPSRGRVWTIATMLQHFFKVPGANGAWPINTSLVKGSLAEKALCKQIWCSQALLHRSQCTAQERWKILLALFCGYKCFGIKYCLILQGNYLPPRTYVPVAQRIIIWIFVVRISNLLSLLLKEYFKDVFYRRKCSSKMRPKCSVLLWLLNSLTNQPALRHQNPKVQQCCYSVRHNTWSSVSYSHLSYLRRVPPLKHILTFPYVLLSFLHDCFPSFRRG